MIGCWVKRQQQAPYKCAIIFWTILAVTLSLDHPFRRELLRRGTRVVLCANSKPALNDVTAEELMMVMRQVVLVCPVMNEHLAAGTLCVRESGQASPCLDLRLAPRLEK
ncbi:Pantothenate kinase 4 [Chionoecetes opilio]|uniref:Pantothenate kinase 4 n=1 Tax=Chionoecetes opilio TaxID=41210 RepID=A0A8J5CLU3_CHIOP|nr:Pantothenate kinase 4 [Chionoecetes opilio]